MTSEASETAIGRPACAVGAYQTRHTYAANALAAGVNPAYIARQMGHKNAKMRFSVYAKWGDGADRGREKAKLEAALRNEKAAHKKAA